ncbi:hypothetical protein [Variovorax sp. M-6]|uniref:hypothetical protein n=1 Tax=Variovorax sp. M-6 TaxID=3233041 RepID=UPI003F97BFDA
MHALVGCHKRWTNSLARRFQSLDIIRSPSVLSQNTAPPGAAKAGFGNVGA